MKHIMKYSIYTLVFTLLTLSSFGQWQSNFGIGVDSAKFKLDVNGDINISSGHNYLINGIPIDLNSLWNTNELDAYYSQGNVGIGLNQPMAKLDIKDSLSMFSFKFNSGHSQFKIGNSGTGYSGLILDASDGDGIGSDYFNIYQDNELNLRLESMYYAGDIIFMTKLGLGQTDEKESMRIIKGGNVGIGVSEPNEKLEVNGNILIKENNALILTSPNGTEYKITVDDSGNLTTSQITSEKSIILNSNVKIYPNPTNQQLIIEINDEHFNTVDVELYDLSGKMVFMKNYNYKSIQINT